MKFRKHYFIIITFLCSLMVWGFHRGKDKHILTNNSIKLPIAKLDPKLQLVHHLYKQSTLQAPASIPLCNIDGQLGVPCIIRTTGDYSKIEQLGVMIGSHFGDIFTAIVPLEVISQLEVIPDIVYMEASRKMSLTMDFSVPAINGDLVHNRFNSKFTGYTGKGIIIGDIDTGIDFTHPDFINPDGTSRILYIWDQNDGGGPSPTGFTYGTEWTQTQINDEIDGSPAGIIRHKDTNGHGTHTAGTAAGNGRATGNGYPADRYIGVAPEADLIIVKSGLQTASVLDALNYIQSKAATIGKPCVINNSYGSQYGPHDGTRNLEIAFDNATGPGKVLVVSAGNNGNHHNISPVPQPPPDYNTMNQIHARGTAVVGNDLEITFEVPAYPADPGSFNDEFELDMWYQGQDKITVTIITPGGDSFSRSTGDAYIEKATDDGTIWIGNANSGQNPNNGDNECYIYVADKFENKPPTSGTWKISIRGIDLPAGGAFDIWADYNTLTSNPYEIIFTSNFVNEVLVASPGNATKPITVAAYVTKNDWICPTGQKCGFSYNQNIGDIAWFSSPGPRRDGVLKPDIAAPGSNIAAARSKDWITSVYSLVEDGVHGIMQGTSMSAPHVTGAVALLLQQNPSLSNDEVKNILSGTSVTDMYTGTIPNPVWGNGKLDVYAAMGGTKSTQVVSGTGLDTFPFPNGNVGIEFTQHTGSHEVTVEMFTSMPPNTYEKILPRHYNLSTTAQNFVANLTFPYTQNEFDKAGFNVNELGLYLGKSTDGGQTWEAVPSVVDSLNNKITTSDVTSFSMWAIGAEGAVPVELASFTASAIGEDVVLIWETLSETNNLGFEIYRRIDKNEFDKVGFIPGAGTTTVPQTYEFVDSKLGAGSYYYRLRQLDTYGTSKLSSIVKVIVNAPEKFRLYSNYPNPFNTSTIISYDLPLQSLVELKVINMFGQEVMSLVNKWQTAGHYQVIFDASNLTSGLYLYRLSTNAFSKTNKMLFIR